MLFLRKIQGDLVNFFREYRHMARGIKLAIASLLLMCCTAFGNSRGYELVQHVKKSLANTEQFKSKMIPQIYDLQGMSSFKVRCLLNNLGSLPDARYLEIGCWKGSTLVSALYGNEDTMLEAIAIDNWSEFGSVKKECLANIDKYIPLAPLSFYEDDCFKIEKNEVFDQPINIYFFDGKHDVLSHEKAFTYFDDILDDVFIAIVDDWNMGDVRVGTATAFRKLGYEILFEQAFFTKKNCDKKSWWNGFYVAVVKKTKTATK
jgi:hypothetical protein